MNFDCFSLIDWDVFLMGHGIMMNEKIKTFPGTNVNRFRYSTALNNNTSPVKLYKSASLKYRRKVEDLPPIANRSTEKPKAVLIYRNGDMHFQGLQVTVTPKRFRNFDNLLTELTRVTNLPQGARYIFTPTNGTRVDSLEQLHNGRSYVCDSRPKLKKIDYNKIRTRSRTVTNPRETKLSNSYNNISNNNNIYQIQANFDEHPDGVKPKIITAVRNGIARPHSKIKLVLNKRTAHNLLQVLDDITSAISSDGCIRKLYNLQGKRIQKLTELFNDDSVFIAVGNERFRSCDIPIIKEELGINQDRGSYKANNRVSGGLSLIPRKTYSLRYKPTRPKAKPETTNNGYEHSLLKIAKPLNPSRTRRNSEDNDTIKALDDFSIVKHYDDEQNIYLNEEQEKFLSNIPYLNCNDNIYIQNQQRSKVDHSVFGKSSMNNYQPLPPINGSIVSDYIRIKDEEGNFRMCPKNIKKQRNASLQSDDEHTSPENYSISTKNHEKSKSGKINSIIHNSVPRIEEKKNSININEEEQNGFYDNNGENGSHFKNDNRSNSIENSEKYSNNLIAGGMENDSYCQNGLLKTAEGKDCLFSYNTVDHEQSNNIKKVENDPNALIYDAVKRNTEEDDFSENNEKESGNKIIASNELHKINIVDEFSNFNILRNDMKSNESDIYGSHDSGIENSHKNDCTQPITNDNECDMHDTCSEKQKELFFNGTEKQTILIDNKINDIVVNTIRSEEEFELTVNHENQEHLESLSSKVIDRKEDSIDSIESGYDTDKHFVSAEEKDDSEHFEDADDADNTSFSSEVAFNDEKSAQDIKNIDDIDFAFENEDILYNESKDNCTKKNDDKKIIEKESDDNNENNISFYHQISTEDKDIESIIDIKINDSREERDDEDAESDGDDEDDDEDIVTFLNKLKREGEMPVKLIAAKRENVGRHDDDDIRYIGEFLHNDDKEEEKINTESFGNNQAILSLNESVENETDENTIEKEEQNGTKTYTFSDEVISGSTLVISDSEVDNIKQGIHGQDESEENKETDKTSEINKNESTNDSQSVINNEIFLNAKQKDKTDENDAVISKNENGENTEPDVNSRSGKERFIRENVQQIFSPYQVASENSQANEVFTNDGIRAFYDIGDVLGDGNFAVVREARDKRTNKYYALKIIDASKIDGKEVLLQNEITIQRECNHPNLVKLYHDFHSPADIFLVMELVSGGDFFDYISDNVKLDEEEASMYIRDMCSGIDYLHEKSVVHRDIKPENLLLCTSSTGDAMLKITDFGLAQRIASPLYTVCGTPTYVAPEILTEEGYGIEVDIWAAGVILYIMLCGFPPFRSNKRGTTELFDIIEAGVFEFLPPYWDQISELSKDLISGMLLVDVKKRFTAKDILNHKWLEKYGLKRSSVSTEEPVPSETFKTVGKGKLAIEKVAELLKSKLEREEDMIHQRKKKESQG